MQETDIWKNFWRVHSDSACQENQDALHRYLDENGLGVTPENLEIALLAEHERLHKTILSN